MARASENILTKSVDPDIDPDKVIYERKIENIFLPINLNMCFGCAQHMFWMRNKIVFQYTILSGGLPNEKEIPQNVNIFRLRKIQLENCLLFSLKCVPQNP